MKPRIPFILTIVLTITFASCSKPKPESNPEESDVYQVDIGVVVI